MAKSAGAVRGVGFGVGVGVGVGDRRDHEDGIGDLVEQPEVVAAGHRHFSPPLLVTGCDIFSKVPPGSGNSGWLTESYI